MEVQYRVLNLYRSRRYDRCIDLCGNCVVGEGSVEMGRSSLSELVRMRALTIQAKVAGSHYDESEYPEAVDGDSRGGSERGGGDERLGSATLARTPRSGTAFRRDAATASQRTAAEAGAAARLPATARARTGTARARSARPPARTALATAARAARAATALQPDTVAAAALAVGSLASTSDPSQFHALAKMLFEFILFSEGDVRKAMEIVMRAQKEGDMDDWWWSMSAGKCYMILGLTRSAEECLRLALVQSKHVAAHLRLVSMYVGLDQPLSALEVCGAGLALFPGEVALRTEAARVHDALGNSSLAVQQYRDIALHDANNMEAVASIAHYNFYNDQPEIALRYYRRLLATTPANSELYNNLGLCCLACGQWELVLGCFRYALFLATGPRLKADLWFNLAHVALGAGDVALGARCLRASLSAQSDHAPAVGTLRALNNYLKT